MVYIFSEVTGHSIFALWVSCWGIGVPGKIRLNVSRGVNVKCFVFSWSKENYALSCDTP